MGVTEADIARVPVGNLRVSRVEFGSVWVAAERRAAEHRYRGVTDWYSAGVRVTCMWLAGAIRTPARGPRRQASSPVIQRSTTAQEELIEAEYQAAELMAQRQPWLVESRPGWCEGILATLRWAWRHDGPPPLDPDEYPEPPTIPRQG